MTFPQSIGRVEQQLRDVQAGAERLKEAVEAFSVNPDSEVFLLEMSHTTISRFDDHIIRVSSILHSQHTINHLT